MPPLMSRPSVGRKPVGQVMQQPQQVNRQQGPPVNQAPMGQQQIQQQPVYQQGHQGQMYQQQPMQQPTHQQQPIQQPVFQQGQQQQPMYQQPVPLSVQQQQIHQQQGQQQPIQQRLVQQHPVHQQQALQQPIYQQQTSQQPVQQYQQAIQQRPVQHGQMPTQQPPVQQPPNQPQSVQQPHQILQQRPVQQQPAQQYQHQQPIQQQSGPQRPIQQQPPQQQPVQQHSMNQLSPASFNATPQAANRQSLSSAASVRSVGSVTSSHTNPSQTFSSPTSFPASVSQHGAPSFITCSLCTTDISNDSTHLECLACTSTQIPTFFCTQCCVSKSAVTSHHHHMSNFVSVSDVAVFDPEVSTYGWDARKTAIGITWYHHKGSKIKTFEKPKPPIPVTQPQVFRAESNLLDGWEEIKDPDGRLFYYHRASKVSKWTRPQGNKLPTGWMECTNPDGRTYYLNTISQATTWDRPLGPSTLASDDQKLVSSTKSSVLETAQLPLSDKRQSISSQGQNTATPQSPTSIRSSTILETVEWSPTEIENTTVPAHRAISMPNNLVQTTNWSPSDAQHRPIPTRAETQPQPGEWLYDQSGHRRQSRTFSKESIASGSAAASKAVVKSTKTAASATAKGVKVAAKKLKNSKNAQRIVAGVGMAAVNAVLINQLGISIPTSFGTAAVGLVNAIDFDETTTVVDVTDTDVTVDPDPADNVDVGGDVNQASILDSTGGAIDVNQMNNMTDNNYGVGDETEVIQTTVVQEEIIFVPGGPTPMIQQPQQMKPGGTYASPQHMNSVVPQSSGPGPNQGPVEWEFGNMQRPAAMIGSHIPIHVPNQANQRMAPTAGVQSRRAASHLGAGQHPQPGGHSNFGNVAQSHIPIHNVQHTSPHQNQPLQQGPNQIHNPGQSPAVNQPQWANQLHINSPLQGQNQQRPPQQLQNILPPHQPPGPQQAPILNQQQGPQPHMPNQQQGPQPHIPNQQQGPQPHMPNQQQGPQPHMPNHQQGPRPHMLNQQQGPQPHLPNQPQFSQPHNLSQTQRPQFHNAGGPQGALSQYPAHPSGSVPVQRPPVVNSKPSKPLLKPHQKKALMNAGMKMGTSLLKSAIRSSMSGNSGGGNYDYDDNDDSYDFSDNSNFNVRDSDFSNDGDDSNDNLDTTDYDTQDQDQDQFVDTNQQFDSDLNDDSYDTGNANDMNTYGGNDQFVDSGISPDNVDDGSAYIDPNIDQQGMDTTGCDNALSAEAGFDTAPDTTYGQQSDINQQAQGILQDSMENDNAAMDGAFMTPDVSYIDQPYIDFQSQGIFQSSMEDDNAAMNGGLSVSDACFPQDAMADPNNGTDTNTVVASNLWTVDVPDTSNSQATAASQDYAGLTSASLSGPMTDFYDSFGSFGGEIPLDQDLDEDEDGDTNTPVDTSSGIQNTVFFQDPTLALAGQDISGPLNRDANTLTPPSTGSDQPRGTDDHPTTQASDIGTTTPTNNTYSTGAGTPHKLATISHLYDGSAYDDPNSAAHSPLHAQSTMPPMGMAGTKMAPIATVMTLTSPAMPAHMLTPDPMPDPALLIVG